MTGLGTDDACEARRLLDYDPRSGLFRWRVRASNRVHVGDEAGTYAISSRTKRPLAVLIRFQGKPVLAHRLAWLWTTGDWPFDIIDHKDGDPYNNAWSNLRLADKSTNAANSPRPLTNTSGFKGASWNKSAQKWSAQIKVNQRPIHLGLFNTVEEAHAAYCAAAQRFFGDFARAA